MHVEHIENGLALHLPYYGVETASILEYKEYVEHVYSLEYTCSIEYL